MASVAQTALVVEAVVKYKKDEQKIYLARLSSQGSLDIIIIEA